MVPTPRCPNERTLLTTLVLVTAWLAWVLNLRWLMFPNITCPLPSPTRLLLTVKRWKLTCRSIVLTIRLVVLAVIIRRAHSAGLLVSYGPIPLIPVPMASALVLVLVASPSR